MRPPSLHKASGFVTKGKNIKEYFILVLKSFNAKTSFSLAFHWLEQVTWTLFKEACARKNKLEVLVSIGNLYHTHYYYLKKTKLNTKRSKYEVEICQSKITMLMFDKNCLDISLYVQIEEQTEVPLSKQKHTTYIWKLSNFIWIE